MMLKKITIYIVMAVLCPFFGRSQALKVGDKVPDGFWKQLHSIYAEGKSSKLDLSSYRGRAMILDFWASWCGSCIAGFPRLDSIAAGMGGRLKVIKVTYEPRELVEKAFDQDLDSGQHSSFEHASIYADTYLRGLFPNSLLPHYVWIGENGHVAAITTARDINLKNIQSVLEGRTGFLFEKVDQDASWPLLLSTALQPRNQLMGYSIFFKGMFDGLSQGVKNHMNDKGEVIGRTVSNLPLVELYEAVAISPMFSKLGKRYSTKLRVIETDRPELVVKDYQQPSGFSLSDYYSFSRRFDRPVAEGLEQVMLQELNRCSGYYGRLESRIVPCLVLQQIETAKGAKVPGNYPVVRLVNRLNLLQGIGPIVLDGTTNKLTADISLPLKGNLAAVQAELAKNGLVLVEGKKEMTVFVLGSSRTDLVLNNR